MIGLGTIINTLAVIAGGMIGLCLKVCIIILIQQIHSYYIIITLFQCYYIV